MSLVAPADAAFLWGESRTNPTHVVGLQLFEPPPDAGPEFIEKFVADLRSHDDVKPSFRRRPHRSWSTGGMWTWVVDDEIDFDLHVRRAALPSPGRVRELLEYVSALHGTLLDPTRPLWEFHVVEGLEDGRFAVCSKLHHALFDGVTMSRHLISGLSTDPQDRSCAPPWSRSSRSGSHRSGSAPAADPAWWQGLADGAAAAWRTLAGLPGLVDATARMVTDEHAVAPFRAPDSMLNVPITATRRFAGDQWPVERLRAVARAAGGTSNDVALAMCGGALRRYLLEHDALPDEPLVAMVPVDLRGEHGGDGEGNAFGAILCDLATECPDAGDRWRRVTACTAEGKARLGGLESSSALALSGLAMGGAFLGLVPALPSTPRPAFNLIISNVPFPREVRYWNGARLDDIYPVSMVFDGQALNITITSYVDRISFGLAGDRRSLPHLQRMLGHLESELRDLEESVART